MRGARGEGEGKADCVTEPRTMQSSTLFPLGVVRVVRVIVATPIRPLGLEESISKSSEVQACYQAHISTPQSLALSLEVNHLNVQQVCVA